MGRGLDGNAQRLQTAQVLFRNRHGVGDGDSAVELWHCFAGVGRGVQSNAQRSVAAGVQVRVQVCFEERRQKHGKRFPREQNGAAAAAGVGFENGGGFAFNGSVVRFWRYECPPSWKRRIGVFVECSAPLPRR